MGFNFFSKKRSIPQSEETCVPEVQSIADQANHMMSTVDNVTASIQNQVSEVNNTINTVNQSFNKAVDVYQYCKEMEEKTKQLQVCADVQLEKIAQQYGMFHELLEKVYGERAKGINASYQTLDKALQDNDRDMIIASLRSITTIVSSSPKDAFEAFEKMLDDPDTPLEIDF